jgi:Prophage tail fibre N-terminal.
MDKRILIPIIAVVLLSLTLFIPASDAADPPSSTYTIKGWVGEIGGGGIVPKKGVEVEILEQNGNNPKTVTDADGIFSLSTITDTNLQIKFTVEYGYSLLTCPNVAPQSGSDYLLLNLNTSRYFSATRTYEVTSDLSGYQCAIVKSSEGTISGNISYSGGGIKNATVTLTPLNGNPQISAVTDSNGNYTITCPVGRYELSVRCQGFEPNNAGEVLIPGATGNFTLQKNHVREYMGLDLAHIFMLLGVCLGIILAFITWTVSRRRNDPSGLEIIDDSSVENIEDDIRHP